MGVFNVDGRLVDTDTGEILEGEPGSLDRIVQLGLEAKTQMDEWEKRYNVLRAMTGKMLRADGQTEYVGESVQANLRGRTDRKITGQSITDLNFELTSTDKDKLLRCVTSFKFADVEKVLPDIAEAAVEETHPTWVEFKTPRKQAPK